MEIKWQALNKPGSECLSWQGPPQEPHFQSTVFAQPPGEAPYELHYSIDCDAGWHVRHCDLQVGGRRLQLRSDGRGEWQDGSGQQLPVFAGCYDLDISATPFTNTLPIRRLQLAPGHPATIISVVYIEVPKLTLALQLQRYSWCRVIGDTVVIYYENLTSGYAAELLVDANGLVLNYPGLFQRI